MNSNHLLGLLCIIAGMVIIILALGDLLARIVVGLLALSLINYGLRLRGLPPLQLLIPMLANRHRWF
jgi:hypothetical protein